MRNAYLSAALLLVLGGAVGGTSSTPAVSQGQAAVVPAPWAVEDPADSLYRAARDALNRNDYTRAADLFRKIRDTYPQSQYTPDAYYWEAFALYRRGGTTDLKTALGSLDVQEKKYPKAATRGDARSLATRISSELAKRGDPVAAAKVDSQAKTAAQGCPDPDDEDDVRIAALNGLLQMDADRAIPILKKVLARRDQCSVGLRRKAVFLVSQKHSPETESILLDAARNDPDEEVRQQAVFWLSQVGSETAVSLGAGALRSALIARVHDVRIVRLERFSGITVRRFAPLARVVHRFARAIQAARDRRFHALRLASPRVSAAFHGIVAKLVATALQILARVAAGRRRHDQRDRCADCCAERCAAHKGGKRSRLLAL